MFWMGLHFTLEKQVHCLGVLLDLFLLLEYWVAAEAYGALSPVLVVGVAALEDFLFYMHFMLFKV